MKTVVFVKVDQFGDRRTLKKVQDPDLYFVIPRIGESVKVKSNQDALLFVAGVQHDISEETVSVFLIDKELAENTLDKAKEAPL